MFRNIFAIFVATCAVVHSLPFDNKVLRDDKKPDKDESIGKPIIGGGHVPSGFEQGSFYSDAKKNETATGAKSSDGPVLKIETDGKIVDSTGGDSEQDKDSNDQFVRDLLKENQRSAEDLINLSVLLNRNGNQSKSSEDNNKNGRRVERQAEEEDDKGRDGFDSIINLHVDLDNNNNKNRDNDNSKGKRGAENIIQLLARLGSDKDDKDKTDNKEKAGKPQKRDTDRIDLLARLGDNGEDDKNDKKGRGESGRMRETERSVSISTRTTQDESQGKYDEEEYERRVAVAKALALRKLRKMTSMTIAKQMENGSNNVRSEFRRNDRIDLLAKIGGKTESEKNENDNSKAEKE